MTKNIVIGYALGPVGSAIVGLVTLPIITWFYSVEDIGRISMLQVVASLAVLVFCFGLDQAYVRAYHETEDKQQLFKLTFMPGFVLLTLLSGLLMVIKPELISELLYGIRSTELGLVSLICFVLSFAIRFMSLILRMQDRALAYSMSQLLSKVLFLAFILGIVWIGAAKSASTLIAAQSLSICVVFFVFAWNTRKEWYAAVATRIDRSLLHKHLAFGLPLVIGGLASWGLNVMDKLFLRGMSTFMELGVYSVAMSIASVATILSGVFNIIWAPMVFKWISDGNQEQIEKINQVSESVLVAVYFLIALSGLFSWVLPLLLPEEYSSIQFLITACLIGPLLYTLSEATAIGIAISKKTSYSMIASVGAMLVNAIGNYLLVPRIGAVGAAISTAIAFLCFYVLRTEFSCLVWRAVPRAKSYLMLMLVMCASVISILMQEEKTTIIIWIGILGLGLIVFRPTVVLAVAALRKTLQN